MSLFLRPRNQSDADRKGGKVLQCNYKSTWWLSRFIPLPPQGQGEVGHLRVYVWLPTGGRRNGG